MTQLVTVTEVAEAMSTTDVTGMEPAIESAISRATIRVETFLRTSLSACQVVDLFYIDSRAGDPLDGFYRLVLSNGLVKEEPTVASMDGVAGTPTSVTGFYADKLRGVVKVPASESKRYVSVSYRSGYIPNDKIDERVKQAIICFTPLLLLTASSQQIEAKVQKAAMERATNMDGMGEAMLLSLHRNVGAAIHPVNSIVTILTAW